MTAVHEPSIGALLAGNGWQAGSVLTPAAVQELRPHLRHGLEEPVEISEQTWAIVITQTCDLVAASEETERYAEILLAKPLKGDKPRSQFAELRSTRILDFYPDKQKREGLVLSAHANHERYLVPRQLLTKHRPDPEKTLSTRATQRLQGWLALRISRPAWPENFVPRLGDKQTLVKVLQGIRADLAEIRVAVTPNDRELAPNQPYGMAVFFIMDEDAYQDPALRRAVTECFTQFIAFLRSREGIELQDELSGVVNGGEFSWQQTQQTDPWNFAQLSPFD